MFLELLQYDTHISHLLEVVQNIWTFSSVLQHLTIKRKVLESKKKLLQIVGVKSLFINITSISSCIEIFTFVFVFSFFYIFFYI